MILMGQKSNIITPLEVFSKNNFMETIRNLKVEDINQKQLNSLSKYTFQDDFKP